MGGAIQRTRQKTRREHTCLLLFRREPVNDVLETVGAETVQPPKLRVPVVEDPVLGITGNEHDVFGRDG